MSDHEMDERPWSPTHAQCREIRAVAAGKAAPRNFNAARVREELCRRGMLRREGSDPVRHRLTERGRLAADILVVPED
ncbi:hypothetical protein [Methylobacterium brachythecii]|uniref:Uncharacterized protein n=2 Tax=Methylobacterium brachythecii TaxID=1176177 RepID=A0A7W6ANX4_9HYPH|nr:hypothetical protein [Methylobacterium brachythecii]MBB3905259.1 hypothetical protein [Methylobacterium brachythecii]